MKIISDLQSTYKCLCKEKKHTVDLEKPVWVTFAKLVRDLGENQNVHYVGNGKTYIVPRIFTAIHGLRGKDLPLLGFKEGIEWQEKK